MVSDVMVENVSGVRVAAFGWCTHFACTEIVHGSAVPMQTQSEESAVTRTREREQKGA